MAIFIVLAIIAPACGVLADEPAAEALYKEHCAQCHEAGIARAPTTAALKQLSPSQILVALMFGSMSAQGRDLSGPQIKSLLRYLANAGQKPEAPLPDASCHGAVPLPQDVFAQPYWNGWGVDISQHRFQPATRAQLSAEDVPRLKLKWAFAFPGDASAFAQPTVVGGRILVGSAGGKVYSLDAQTGCVRWVFDADFEVRTAISIVTRRSGWSALFGNVRADVFAVDAETGELLWKTHAAEHPASIVKGAPTIVGTTLYAPLSSAEEVLAADPHYQCCTFGGGVTALDAETGKLLWQGHAIAQAPQQVRKNKLGIQLWGPSGAAIWSSPTIDPVRRMVYVTTGDSYSDPAADTSDAFVAFEMETGKLAWFRQMTTGDTFNVGCEIAAPVNCPQVKGPDFDFGSSPILVELKNGRRALIAGQKSGVVHAIDPDQQGNVLWQTRVGRGGSLGGVQWGSAVDADNIYVAVSDVVVEVVPEGTAGGQKPEYGEGNFRPDPNAGGGLYALKLETGQVVWHMPHPGCGGTAGCSPAQSAAVTAIPGIVLSGGIDGHLRAYSAKTGAIVWDVDTKQQYNTVNGVSGRGGSLDGPGAVVVGGMLYVNSGYTKFGTTPGNVLLAFSVDGK